MRRATTLTLMLALAALGVASAQETTTGSLAGQVADSQGARVPGATVTVTSDQGAKPFVTDGNGRFFAPFLTPGRYTVRVELQGFSTAEQKNVEVRLGQRLELSFTLKVGGVEEVVEVVGAAPVVDTSSTTAGGILDSDTLKRLPVGRNLSDTLYLVPGVSSGGLVGETNPSVAGASGLENNYVVDGVNITNTGYGALGSYSINFGSLGNGVTTDFIKETQVKTAGFEAEYGQSTGGVINVVTKSGTNDLHGSVFGYFRPEFLEGDYEQLTTTNGTVNRTGSQVADVGATLGAPIVKDKLFFFGAFNPQFNRASFIAPEGFPLRSLGDVDRKRRTLSYAGKLTWQLGAGHRFDASFFGDPAKGKSGAQRFSALIAESTAGFSELDYGGHNQVLKYDGILSRTWLVEASVARASNRMEEIPSVDEWEVTDTTVVPNVRTGGVGQYEALLEGANTQYSLKSTHLFDAAGSHQVRYGVVYEDIDYDQVNQRTGPTFTLPNGQLTVTGAEIVVLPDPVFGRIFRVARANTENVRDTTQRYLSFFVQDTWKIGKRLTIRPGLRYEEQKLVGNLADFKWDNNWAPRIGVIFDPRGDGKSKLYANWGRFYAKIPNDLAARALGNDAGVTIADYFDAALTRPVPDGVEAAGQTRHFLPAGTSAAEIDPESKSSYQDELLGGVEFEPVRGLNVGLRYTYRTLPRVLEDVGTAAFVLYDLGAPGLDSVEYFITNPRDGFPGTVDGLGAFEDPIHKYHAVELFAAKTFTDNWALLASYRWSRLRGNFEGFFRNDNGQSDPAISSLFDFPTNDPSYTEIGVPRFGYRGDVRFLGELGEGPLPNDRTHQVKVYGNYAWSSLNLGVGFNASSGRPLTPLAANPNYQSAGEIPEAPRGSGIQTAFGFKKRSDAEITVDLHADYGFRLGGARRLILAADVFNLLDRQKPMDYDNTTEVSFGAPNPDFGQPQTVTLEGTPVASFQTPRQVRLGLRFEW